MVVLSACSKKTLPVIATRTIDPPPPVSPVINVKPDMETGKAIFTSRCNRCHDLPELAKYKAERWDGILKIMMPRARLNREQEVHIAAYIKANCFQ